MTTEQKPTEAQRKLAAWGDYVEEHGPKTSLYYRLLPQIDEARDAVGRVRKPMNTITIAKDSAHLTNPPGNDHE